ncbi:DNA methyltransferase [Erythrobacter sp. GH1-10]|uniref:DNA methyltransferase n=1 Tax=Erythrobacter sp. GH1-10 TaxID=3349334 RepID=UPI00387813D8
MLDCSNRSDVVVDPCLGSETTVLAAAMAGRRGAGMELDPLYVDTAIRRITAATGLNAVLDGDGRTFDEIAQASHSEVEEE